MSLHRRSLTVATALVLSLAGLGVNASAEDAPAVVGAETGRPAEGAQPEPIARGLIVKTTTATPSDSLLEATDDALASEAEVADDDVLLKNVSTIDFDESVKADVAAEAAAEIQKRGDVVWATPNTRRRATSTPPVSTNDPLFPNQLNLWDSTYGSAAYSIKAPSLWQVIKGSSNVRVAVVDTGLVGHGDLGAEQTVPGYDFVGPDDPTASPLTYNDARDGDGWDSDPTDQGDWYSAGQCGPGVPAADSSWHGTFVAGQIAAKTDNGVGMAGIAPGVRVQPVRVLSRCGGWDSDIIAGLTWASGGAVADVPPNQTPSQVVNVSLGYTYDELADRTAACAPYAAAAAAGRARGSLFVAAAGNDGANANLAVPASCPGFVSVGATSAKGFSALYSNIGTSVDLSAPGGDTLVEGAADSIISLGNNGKTTATTSKYVRYEGTSMAAPQVSAAAALLLSLGVTADKLESALLSTVSPFRARSASYANKRISFAGQYFYVDLNCAGHKWCGRGTLDLSRVQVPISKPTISGTPIIGEPLTAVSGDWVRVPTSFTYQWYRDTNVPIEGATSATYYPTRDDITETLSVQMRPGTAAYSMFSSTSEPTAPVPDGPEVTMTGLPATTTYGVPATASVTVAGAGSAEGVVELRRGSTVLTSQPTTDGTAELTIGGTAWNAGSNTIRAAFIPNDSAAPRASSVGVPVTVAKASSSVTTSLRTTVRYTSRATIGITVAVAGVPNPTGNLEVLDGTKRIGLATLSSSAGGKAAILLPRLAKGRHSIKVVYHGNANIAGRTSSSRFITSY